MDDCVPLTVQLVVLCHPHAPEREAHMREQLGVLCPQLPVHYLAAFVPATSTAYLDVAHDVILDVPPRRRNAALPPPNPSRACCLRTHAAALAWFVARSDRDVLVVLEDDVALALDFGPRLAAVLAEWEALHAELAQLRMPERVELLSLGYLPPRANFFQGSGGTPPAEGHVAPAAPAARANVGGALSWRFAEALWGKQAYALRRETAARLAALLHRERLSEVAASVDPFSPACAAAPRVGRTKYLTLQGDALLDIFAQHGAVYPPLAVERRLPSTITSDAARTVWEAARDGGFFVPAAYWGAPWAQSTSAGPTPLVATASQMPCSASASK